LDWNFIHDKTRRIEFGRYAEQNLKRRGEGKPSARARWHCFRLASVSETVVSHSNSQLARSPAATVTALSAEITLKHIKGVSGVFTLAKQLDYFRGENPARDTAIAPSAPEAQETCAYTLDEVQSILSLLPEPAATAFAVAAFVGLRHGEIQGLLWENYRDGEIYV
jgi:hypothetical protein